MSLLCTRSCSLARIAAAQDVSKAVTQEYIGLDDIMTCEVVTSRLNEPIEMALNAFYLCPIPNLYIQNSHLMPNSQS